MKQFFCFLMLLCSVIGISQNLPDEKLLTAHSDFEIRMLDDLRLYHKDSLIYKSGWDQGIRIEIDYNRLIYSLNDTCYSIENDVEVPFPKFYRNCPDNIIIDVALAFKNYLIVQNYKESQSCTGHAIESTEYPGEDSMDANGNVVYYSYWPGSSDSYIYDYTRDINLFEKAYFSFAIMEDLLFAFNITEYENWAVKCQFDLFKFENDKLTYCHSDTLSRLPEDDFFDMKAVLKSSAQIKSGYWISKPVFTYSTDDNHWVYSFKPKRWCYLPSLTHENLAFDSIIQFKSYKDCFILVKDAKIAIWTVSRGYVIKHYSANKVKLWNYKINGGYPDNLELLIIEINDEATLYIYHHELWATYHNVYYREGIRPHDYDFRNNYQLGSITEEMTLGY